MPRVFLVSGMMSQNYSSGVFWQTDHVYQQRDSSYQGKHFDFMKKCILIQVTSTPSIRTSENASAGLVRRVRRGMQKREYSTFLPV